MSSLGGGFSQMRRRSHAQNRITQLVREFQRFTAGQIKIENPDFRTLNRTTSSRMKYSDPFVFSKKKSVFPLFMMPFEPDFNHTALMLKCDHLGRFSRDASGFGHHATIFGNQELKQGIDTGYGPSLYQNFDGASTYLQVKDRYNLLNSSTYLTGFSLAARIYPEDLTFTSVDNTKPRIILSKHDDARGLFGYVLGIWPDGSLQYTFTRGGQPYSVATPPDTIKLDTSTELPDQTLAEKTVPPEPPINYDITLAATLNHNIAAQSTFVSIPANQFPASSPGANLDPLGVKMLYPTKTAGQTWYFNASTIVARTDSRVLYSPTLASSNVTQNTDGSIKITKNTDDAENRFYITTTAGYNHALCSQSWTTNLTNGRIQNAADWRNVEITAHVRINSIWPSSVSEALVFYARSGGHSTAYPCEGSAYKGNIMYDSGSSRFQKELGHPFYYSTPNTMTGLNNNFMGRWFGYKFVCYDMSDGNVKLENWIDLKLDGNWVKVDERIDSTGWGSSIVSSCGGSTGDLKFLWGGPLVGFRFDSAKDIDFNKMSVREIDATTSPGYNPAAGISATTFGVDTFGVQKLYGDDPAKPNHWFMTSLTSDPMVNLSGSASDKGGGEWEGHVTTSDNPASFRINVKTKSCQSDFSDSLQARHGENWVLREADGYTCKPDDWRNVEMTIFWKVLTWSASDEMSPYVRGGSHHDGWPIACIATEYKGQIQKAGNSRFAKEFHHLSGSTGYAFYSANPRFQLSDRTNVWTGHKFVCYDFVRASDGKKCVMNEVWVETSDEATGNPTTQNWRLMNQMVDDGTLADCPEKGYVSNCNGIAKAVFRWGSGMATFRIDNVIVRVKKASIRNILGTGGSSTPPPPPTCPSGQHWDAALQLCVVDQTTPPPPTCPTGQHFDVTLNKCVDDTVTTPPPPPPPPTAGSDKFGVKMIYATKTNGDTWFINANPGHIATDTRLISNTPTFTFPAADVGELVQPNVRLGVKIVEDYNQAITFTDQVQLRQRKYMQSPNDWKNTEMTGYFNVKHQTGATSNGGVHIEMSVRGAWHQAAIPCLGTGYHMSVYPNGQLTFQKELSNEQFAVNNPTKEGAVLNWVAGQWFGLKMVTRSTNANTVKIEAWLDSVANNTWLKVFETEDVGTWGGAINGCGGSDHTIINWGGPIAMFRWDNIDDIQVKWWSVREINSTTSTAQPLPDPTDPIVIPIICPPGQQFDEALQKCVFPNEQTPPPAGHVNQYGIREFFADPEVPRFFDKFTNSGIQGSKDTPFRYNFNLPMDCVNTEFTGLIKVTTNIQEHITVKLGGGIHTTKQNMDGCCYDMGIPTQGQSPLGRLLRKECPHPEFTDCSPHVVPLITLPNLYNVEIGVAVIKVNMPNPSKDVLLQCWINLTPTTTPGGNTMNNNTWQKYWEYIDRGSCFANPLREPLGSSRQDLVMVDNCTYTMRFPSIREVIPISIALSPPDLCNKLSIAGITASDFETQNPPAHAIDNNTDTRWSSLGIGQWIQLDLGATANLLTVCSLDIDWYHGDDRQYTFAISVSLNGQLFTEVFAGRNIRGRENYVLSRQITTNARFVRVTVSGNTVNQWASINEIVVRGFSNPATPGPTDPPSCPQGFVWNSEKQMCDNAPNPVSVRQCLPGMHWDSNLQVCVVNNPLPITNITLDLAVNNVHYTTVGIDPSDETLLPSGKHLPLASGDTARAFRVGTLIHDENNPMHYKFKGGISDVRVYREYILSSIETQNLYQNKMTIRSIPFGQVGVVGFASLLTSQTSSGGFHISGFHPQGFHTGQTAGVSTDTQTSSDEFT